MPSELLKRSASSDRNISPPPTKRKVPASTTSAAVANFFKPASDKAKEPENVEFKIVDHSVLVARFSSRAQDKTVQGRTSPVKVAAFDFDGTTITTASGNRFGRDAQDWKWWHASVPERFNQLHEEGYAIIVVSNQGAVKLHADPNLKAPKGDMKSLQNFKGKITAVLTRLELPITVYAATMPDLYRKPRTGMWELMLKDYGLNDVDVDHEHSIFVGDAAGRLGDNIRKKDHSCSDRDFAANVGIAFQTPEEFFLQEDTKPFTRAFDPTLYLDTMSGTDALTILYQKRNDIEIVLFCGSPGAGKSTFYWTQMQPLGYERVNQDILKTRDKCLYVTTQFVEEGKAVVVDNTNADVDTRASWIKLARRLNVPIRLVYFTAPAKLCEHNGTARALANESMNPEGRSILPKMAFTGFAARFREPKIEEGFEDIFKVDFKFQGSEDQRRIWKRFWIS